MFRTLVTSPFTRTPKKLLASFGAQRFISNTITSIHYQPPLAAERKRVTLIPGDGIGPEICSSVMGVFQAASVPVDWDIFEVPQGSSPGNGWPDLDIYGHKSFSGQVSQDVISSISRNRVALKGPFHTPLLSNAPSRNLELRKALDLYAHIIPCQNTHPHKYKIRHDDVPIDLVIIRENVQGEYSGLEQTLVPGVVQSLKVVSKESCERIARFAFEYARIEGRKKVTAIHKANIQKMTDGLFLEVCRTVAKEYPNIQFNDMIVDNCCMQLVMKPEQFDVMLTPNLYGNLVTNIGAALVGGPGVCPGVSVGHKVAVFEMGSHHVAADIAGQDLANPTGLLLSAGLMLRHIGLDSYANIIEGAVRRVIADGTVSTHDMGGNSSTRQFTQAVIDEVEHTIQHNVEQAHA